MCSPPNSTVLWRTGSEAIECQKRAYGATEVATWVQLDPSHSHVSATRPMFGSCPPKRTARPRLESKARPGPVRGDGEVAGCSCIQEVPSYSQVSGSINPNRLKAPKSSIRARAES